MVSDGIQTFNRFPAQRGREASLIDHLHVTEDVLDACGRISGNDLYPSYLPRRPRSGIAGGLARFKLTAGKFPESAEAPPLRPANDKVPTRIVPNDHDPVYFGGQ